MISNRSDVRKQLWGRTIRRYDPQRTPESSEDHDTDWFALSQAEFDTIKQAAEAMRMRRVSLATVASGHQRRKAKQQWHLPVGVPAGTHGASAPPLAS